MPSIFDPEVESWIRARAARLSVASQPLWGRMQSGQMLCHLVDACRVPLGETAASHKWTPFRFFALRWIFVHLLPWPKGKVPTMKEFQQTQPSQLDLDRSNWNDALSRCSWLEVASPAPTGTHIPRSDRCRTGSGAG